MTAVNLNAATITDGAGNAANLSLSGLTQGSPQIDTTAPTVSSVVESPSSGDLDAGNMVTLTLNLSEAVTVAGGTPTLTLNDGGTATYTGGSGTSALTFSYTVGAGQNTADLDGDRGQSQRRDRHRRRRQCRQPVAVRPDPDRPADRHHGADGLVGGGSGTGISNGTGDLDAGKTVTLTLNLSEAVTVSGGTPTLTLNDGGTATYTGGSGTSALTFSYTVGAGQNTPDLTVTAVNLNAATVTDGAGNAANLSGAVTNPAGTQIDTTAPTCRRLWRRAPDQHGGDLDAGKTVTLTLNLSEAVTVAGGTPTLTLNDGGTATYSGGSGTSALTFSYTVGAGQNTPDLTVTAVNLNAATVTDGAGNAANLRGAVTNPGGTCRSILRRRRYRRCAESPANGDLNAGKCDAYAQSERGGDGSRRHADADAQRRRHGHLQQRLRHQRADLQLYGRRRPEHARPHSDGGQSQRRHQSPTVPAMPPISRWPA